MPHGLWQIGQIWGRPMRSALAVLSAARRTRISYTRSYTSRAALILWTKFGDTLGGFLGKSVPKAVLGAHSVACMVQVFFSGWLGMRRLRRRSWDGSCVAAFFMNKRDRPGNKGCAPFTFIKKLVNLMAPFSSESVLACPFRSLSRASRALLATPTSREDCAWSALGEGFAL